ncbi:MAG: tyrosine-type recombinase/integrase [Kiritimatiellae bacterium]|nr:tyrosine-type recombinase/integrase [Kiritimatiellia bacterium]
MAREKGMGNLQREKSGRWTMRVGINGKRYCRSTRTKDRDQAERFLQRFLAPFGLGERRLPLADVWNAYVMSPNRNDLAKATLDSKRNVWMHFARWMERFYLPVDDLAGVTADMVAEYLACLRADLCATTYNSRVCVLREIFHVLASKAGLDEDPWEGVRLRPDDSHSRRELTMDELKRLLAAAKKAGAEWYNLFMIGIYTGLRLGDCCRLDWANINISTGVIQLIPQKTKRHAHGKPITIPVHPALGEALLSTIEQSNDQDIRTILTGPVLPMISEMYSVTRSKVSDRLTGIFHAANIVTSIKIEGRKNRTPEATFHSLRHTFVSFAANAGVPLHIVQSIVGHESTAMTRHYYHENIDALKSAVAAIPTL